MRRQFLFGTVFAAAMAVGLGAQSSPSGYQSSQSESSKNVTVTGCVERGTGSGATGTTGSTTAPGAASSSMSSQFTLTNVTPGSSSASSTTGTTGSTASALPPSATTQGLKLIASSSEDLDKYVSKRVEIRGTIEKASEPSSTTGSTAGSTAGSTGSMSSSNLASLRVTSIREVSGSCSGGQK